MAFTKYKNKVKKTTSHRTCSPLPLISLISSKHNFSNLDPGVMNKVPLTLLLLFLLLYLGCYIARIESRSVPDATIQAKVLEPAI